MSFATSRWRGDSGATAISAMGGAVPSLPGDARACPAENRAAGDAPSGVGGSPRVAGPAPGYNRAEDIFVATFDEYAALPPAALLTRLRRTPAELEASARGRTGEMLSRRPATTSWSAAEIACHLRDVEELFQTRYHTVLGADEPAIFVLGADAAQLAPWGVGGSVSHPLDPDRWAEDRQYARQDGAQALAAFRRRREEVVALLSGLRPAQWERGGIHLGRGRLTLRQWVASQAAHDDNHLDQTRRALEGRP